MQHILETNHPLCVESRLSKTPLVYKTQAVDFFIYTNEKKVTIYYSMQSLTGFCVAYQKEYITVKNCQPLEGSTVSYLTVMEIYRYLRYCQIYFAEMSLIKKCTRQWSYEVYWMCMFVCMLVLDYS